MSEILRLIAGGLLALIMCYIGVLVKRRYKSRVAFFKSACEFSSSLATELGMKKTPMPEIANKFLKGREGEFEKVVESWIAIAKNATTFGFDDIKTSFLKTDEKKELAEFFSSLGKTNLDDQLSHVAYYKNLFEQKRKTSEDEDKKLGGMYFKLCVLFGLAILLILA